MTRPPSAHRAAVLGSPITHSLSPTLYRAGFAALDMTDWSFEAIACDGDKLARLVAQSDDTWAGFAVTMPGKVAAAALAETCSERVAAMGVANTLVRRENRWRAENTDVDGVRGALAAAGVAPSGPVLLLGGGGTARAVVMALAELSWDGPLVIAGRRPQSTVISAELARSRGLTVSEIGITADAIGTVADDLTLAVSTVPAGAADHLAPVLAHVPALLDVVYDPWPTALVAGGASPRVTITGADMLLHQALVQFELITAEPAPGEAMRDALREAVGIDIPLRV